MARSGCKQNWRITAFMQALTASNEFVANWDCVVGRNGNSGSLRTPATICRLPPIYSTGNLRYRRQTALG